MKFALDFHSHTVVKKLIESELDKIDVRYSFHNSSYLEIIGNISSTKFNQIKSNFEKYGIQIKETPNDEFIQKVKDIITELIHNHKYHSYTSSNIISEKLKLSYGHISNIFSNHTLDTLENYIILQRIERVKSLILSNEYTLTEIAFALNYSSVGHLSNQFKKITGLTSTSFAKIVKKRNELQLNQSLS